MSVEIPGGAAELTQVSGLPGSGGGLPGSGGAQPGSGGRLPGSGGGQPGSGGGQPGSGGGQSGSGGGLLTHDQGTQARESPLLRSGDGCGVSYCMYIHVPWWLGIVVQSPGSLQHMSSDTPAMADKYNHLSAP